MNEQRHRQWMVVLLSIGALLRLLHYLGNRSLWYDEAMLAINFIHRDFAGLLQPLAYDQQAPLFYLWFQKIMVSSLGSSEWVLRFASLAASLLGLWLFRKLIAHFLIPKYQLWALAFFAFCQPLVFYAAEVKQYSFDLLFACLLFLICIRVEAGKERLYKLGIVGLFAMGWSMPIVFVLAGIGLYLLYFFWEKRAWGILFQLVSWGGIWLLAFWLNYQFLLRPEEAAPNVLSYHREYFVPLTFWKWESLQWYFQSYFNFFRDPGGIFFKYLAGALAILALVRWKPSQNRALCLLLLPFLFALMASGLQLYSTAPRLLLFSVPLLHILLALGLMTLEDFLKRWPKKLPQLAFIPALLAALLLLQPFLNSLHRLGDGHELSAFRKTLHYIEQFKEQGDHLYVHPSARPQFDYYALRYSFDGLKIVHNPLDGPEWKALFDKGEGRSWVLLSQFAGYDTEYANYLDQVGQKLDEKRVKGSVCLLYDLQENRNPSK